MHVHVRLGAKIRLRGDSSLLSISWLRSMERGQGQDMRLIGNADDPTAFPNGLFGT
jgi:hypothetical protein